MLSGRPGDGVFDTRLREFGGPVGGNRLAFGRPLGHGGPTRDQRTSCGVTRRPSPDLPSDGRVDERDPTRRRQSDRCTRRLAPPSSRVAAMADVLAWDKGSGS